MSFQVELSRRAEGDLDRILAWIAERSPQGERNWLTRWEEVLALLSDRADSGLFAPENEDHVEQIRHRPCVLGFRPSDTKEDMHHDT